MKEKETDSVETKQKLNFDELMDFRIRREKILDDSFNILLEEGTDSQDPNLTAKIRSMCIKLDRELESATLQYRIDNGVKYVNTKNNDGEKIEQYKPVEYKQLNISISESKTLANNYFYVNNDRQIQNRNNELQDFPKIIDIDMFNQYMNELKNLYSFTSEDIMYITHWLCNVKRTILNEDIETPIMLCFYSGKQNIGKSRLASIMAKVINKRITTTDLQKLSARFQPFTLTTEAVLWIDELKKIDKNVSDNVKNLITTESLDFEFKYQNGYKQYKKLASFIMSINYDPSNIFYDDESQRRIGIIKFNGYTIEKTREELESLIVSIWNNTPIEYAIEPKMIADTLLEKIKTNTIFEYLTGLELKRFFENNKWFSLQNFLDKMYNYRGGSQRLRAFLENENYFEYKILSSNQMKVYHPTNTFMNILNELTYFNVDDDLLDADIKRVVSL
jgi:hypothetical protein